MANKHRPFRPDWVTHPGEHLEELLTVYDITQAELAERTGISRKTINAIIRGDMLLSSETAVLLEPVLGRSARTWMNLDAHYRERQAQILQEQRIRAAEGSIKAFPLPALKKRGIVPKTNDIVEIGSALLTFFAISSFDAWQTIWKPSALRVAYRQRRHETKTPEIVSIWLREGQRIVEAHPIPHAFDETKLREILPRLRAISRLPSTDSWVLVRELCAEAGVTIIRVAPYAKLGVYAASYRFRGHTIIQLSGHQRTIDQVWFSLFHEIGHLLLHGVKEIFLDDGDPGASEPDETETLDKQEVEADAFARRQLIPDGAFRQFIRESRGIYTATSVDAFAEEQEVHAGIVVGRLQHENYIKYSVLRDLQEPYGWPDEENNSSVEEAHIEMVR
jgi:addiction module HigA family antidote